MKYIATPILLVAAICLGAHSLTAAVVYDESVSGDITDGNPPLMFLPGSNMILGNTGFTLDSSGTQTAIDFDKFDFAIPTGTMLVSASLSTSQSIGQLTSMEFNFFSSGIVPIVSSQITNNVPSSAPIITDILPVGPGRYFVTDHELGARGFGPSYANYVFDFEVVAVPEPSAVQLSIAALAGLALIFRRRFLASSPLAW
jgi:PEP-CTERM motif